MTKLNTTGAPGSGKGTLYQKLVEDFGYMHLSIGDILRQIMLSDAVGINQSIASCVHEHRLLDIALLEPILKNAINHCNAAPTDVVLIDGFPRQLDQALHIEKAIGAPEIVFFFDCPEHVAKARYVTRELAGRDKSGDIFDKRYQEFHSLNRAIVGEFEKRGNLFKVKHCIERIFLTLTILKVDTSGETGVSYRELLRVLGRANITGERSKTSEANT